MAEAKERGTGGSIMSVDQRILRGKNFVNKSMKRFGSSLNQVTGAKRKAFRAGSSNGS
jgi:hypothetical protein